MAIYFSATSGSFYDDALIGKNDMPPDAVEISMKDHSALLRNQASGRIISSDDLGNPISVDRPPLHDDQAAALARDLRKRTMRSSVDTINAVRWNSLTKDQKKEISDYRQALCDITEQSGFPHTITWPEPPAWL